MQNTKKKKKQQQKKNKKRKLMLIWDENRETSMNPFFRGRRLVIEYQGGSKCPGNTDYYKSSIISFLCDHDKQLAPSISFVGSINECAYFFEFRTARACATVRTEGTTALGPASVFGVILGVAICVYLLGAFAYQRTVLKRTGWRQLPHYETVNGMFLSIRRLISRIFCGRNRHGSMFRRVQDDNALMDEADDYID